MAAEQFAVGGPAFGSANDPGTLAGDQGIAARAELRYSREVSGSIPLAYQTYGFYDVDAVWNKTTALDENLLASTGQGLRLSLMPHLSESAELAAPLVKRIGSGRENGAPHLFFNLLATY